MDTTITCNVVATLIGVNIPSLEPCLTFKKIRALCHHFEQALQCLPSCPQSTLHGWKGLIMSGNHTPYSSPAWTTRSVYAWIRILTPITLGLSHQEWYRTSHLCPIPSRQRLICALHFRSIISYHCKISNVCASLHSMQASMMLSRCLPIPQSEDGMLEWQFERFLTSSLVFTACPLAAMELNDITSCSLYLAANAPKVLFCWIEDCAEIAILGCNPTTDRQLINNAICLLLTTCIYLRTFEELDCLQPIFFRHGLCFIQWSKKNVNNTWTLRHLPRDIIGMPRLGHFSKMHLVPSWWTQMTTMKNQLLSLLQIKSPDSPTRVNWLRWPLQLWHSVTSSNWPRLQPIKPLRTAYEPDHYTA